MSGSTLSPRAPGRKRASSIQAAADYVMNPPSDHHLGGTSLFTAATGKDSQVPASPTELKAAGFGATIPAPIKKRATFGADLLDARWLTNPVSSLKMIGLVLLAWGSWAAVFPKKDNPISHLLFLSYPLDLAPGETSTRYGKGPLDALFLAFYVIVFAFIRQSVTEYLLRPYAKWLEIRGEGKRLRFMEQGYAVIYFGVFGVLGLLVMRDLPTWWYKTEHMWIGYPHWRMTAKVKAYYLLEFSYWLQQAVVMILRLEKPRSDYAELVVHHIVTLWLIGWSYSINLTMIGVAIFVTMDVSDVFLALSKCINYTKYQHTSEVSFAFFLVVWVYLRHYQNIRILYSVATEWDELIPSFARHFRPSEGIWMAGWMKWQIFIPILLLQIVNLFWLYLILRIAVRLVFAQGLKDVREDSEDESEVEDTKKSQ